MKKLLIGLAIVAVLIAAAVAAIPYLVQLDTYRERIAAVVREQTGRDLTIAGPISLSLLPRLAIQLEDVALANAPGGQADALARFDRLDLALELLPLLSGEFAVSRLVLVEPEIALEVDAEGRANWQFDPAAPAGGPQAGNGAGDGSGNGDSGGSAGSGLPELRFDAVEIVDGRLSWTDARSAAGYAVDDLDAVIALPSLDAPATLDADFRFAGRPVELTGRASAVRPLIEGGATEVAVALDAEPLTLSFEGRVDAAGSPAARGALSVAAPSAGDAAQWLGGPAGLPAEPVELTGRIEASSDRVALDDAELHAGPDRAAGSLAVALGGERPAVTGQLALGRLDLDRLNAAYGEAGQPADEAPPAGEAEPAVAQDQIPIELGFLREVDADLDLALDGISMKGIDTGPTTVAIDLAGGRLDVVVDDTAVFDGTVSGRLGLDGAAEIPAASADLRVSGVHAEPLLALLADFDRLSGTTRGTASLRAAGATDRAMLASLDGEGSLIFTDGALEGVNIAALVRDALATVRGQAAAGDAPQRTDFAELGAAFTITDGVARTDDLRLLAPLLRLTGEGAVDLAGQTVDLRLRPRIVASLEGQGGSDDQTGLTVPVLVRGTFDDLSFTPDVAGLAREALQDPEAARRQVEGLRDAVREGRAEDAVRGVIEGLTGGAAEGASEGESEGATDGAADGAADGAVPAVPLERLRDLLGR